MQNMTTETHLFLFIFICVYLNIKNVNEREKPGNILKNAGNSGMLVALHSLRQVDNAPLCF